MKNKFLRFLLYQVFNPLDQTQEFESKNETYNSKKHAIKPRSERPDRNFWQVARYFSSWPPLFPCDVIEKTKGALDDTKKSV